MTIGCWMMRLLAEAAGLIVNIYCLVLISRYRDAGVHMPRILDILHQ